MNMSLKRLRELVNYVAYTGQFFGATSGRQYFPDENGSLTIYDGSTKKRMKVKPERLAWYMSYGKLPEDNERVYHKNLNKEDNRLINLGLVKSTVFNKISEAQRNLSGELRIVPHPVDQYSYILYYQKDGVEHKEVIEDIVSARNKLVRLQLENAKLISKYCVFD